MVKKISGIYKFILEKWNKFKVYCLRKRGFLNGNLRLSIFVFFDFFIVLVRGEVFINESSVFIGVLGLVRRRYLVFLY